MPRGDAVQDQPSAADEMAKFTSFTSKDGETIDPKTEDLNPVEGKNVTEAEKKALAANSNDKGEIVPAVKAAATKLTDPESEAAIAALDAKLGREATEEEISDALKAAAAEKNKGDEGSKKPAKTVQERINKAIKNQRAAERRAEVAEARAATAEAALSRDDTKPLTGATEKSKDAVVDGAPDPKDFDYGELDTKYIRALARFEAKQEFAAQTENQKKTQLTAQEQEATEQAHEKMAVFEEAGSDKYADFEEVVMQGARDKAWPLSTSLGVLLVESEFGPDIAYTLASDPRLAKEVFGKPALQQAAWLGRQEAKLSAGTGATSKDGKAATSEDEGTTKTATAKQVSKAPAPVQRARGQGSNSSVPGDTSDFAAFEAAAMGRSKQ